MAANYFRLLPVLAAIGGLALAGPAHAEKVCTEGQNRESGRAYFCFSESNAATLCGTCPATSSLVCSTSNITANSTGRGDGSVQQACRPNHVGRPLSVAQRRAGQGAIAGQI